MGYMKSIGSERMSGELGWVAFIGGLLIAAALLFGVIANRRRSDHDRRRTEEGTKALYAKMDRQDKVSDPDPEKF